jgi:hypothetical protein
MKKGAPWTTVGYDESNHSRYPEMCVLVASNIPGDLIPSKEPLGKIRKDHSNIEERLKRRDFTFLDFSATAHEIIPSKQKLGIVLANLIYDKPISDHLEVYIDGMWYLGTLNYTRDVLSEITGLERDCIRLITGKDLDKQIPLVNIADETAHWTYNIPPSEWMRPKIKRHKRDLYLKRIFDIED